MYCFCFFFFNDTATTEIYTLSLHDALPIYEYSDLVRQCYGAEYYGNYYCNDLTIDFMKVEYNRRSKRRSEEHTSELQSRQYLVCRLLLEKKKKKKNHIVYYSPLYHM